MPTNLTSEALAGEQGTNQNNKPQFIPLVYINGISETLTLRATLVKAKDSIPKDARRGVMYQFPCKVCNAKCAGGTGKTHKTRSSQHKAMINNHYTSYLIALHCLDTGIEFAFDEAQVISAQGKQTVNRSFSFGRQFN